MDIEVFIRDNVPWTKLPEHVQVMLGKSSREYDKLVLEYSVRNQLRYKNNLVRHVKKNEEMYYDIVMKYSEAHLMLFPYHLSDLIVKELRITPFNYYINIFVEMIGSEKSYDSLPNFTAADAVRLLGIGRNQYIDIMNQNKSNRRLFRRNKSIRELLPTKPKSIHIEPWWLVCPGNILEADVKSLPQLEQALVDILLDEGPKVAATQDLGIVKNLFEAGLVYFDVPVENFDYVYVAPLDGFVMNRVLGDYFETLLYKIFVAIDDQTTVSEMSEMLHIDLQLVKNAISLFCRLGFAKKRVTGVEGVRMHSTWFGHSSNVMSPSCTNDDLMTSSLADLGDLSAALIPGEEVDDEDISSDREKTPGFVEGGATSPQQITSLTSENGSAGRIALVFDSTLTAFLMMGNLSTSLKSHAVTLFEVGKLADEQLGEFMELLGKVNRFAEGEAARYSKLAVGLVDTLRRLKGFGYEVDMIRGESLLSLDTASRVRVLLKSYSLAIAIAPLSSDGCTLPLSSLPFLGPPIPEVYSAWFRLTIYSLCELGPSSLFLPRGERLGKLPTWLAVSPFLLLSSPSHEPQVVPSATALTLINDLLTSTTLLIQEWETKTWEDDLVYVAFPFDDEQINADERLKNQPSLQVLRERLHLDQMCGYIALASIPTRTLGSQRPALTVVDIVFGVPLFSSPLSEHIFSKIAQKGILGEANKTNVQFANRNIADLTFTTIKKLNCGVDHVAWQEGASPKVEVVPPIRPIFFNAKRLSAVSNICEI